MDSLDLKILSCLKNNARAKASQISEEVNLSVSAVTERIKKLEASGVICGYTVVLDQKKLGNDVIALMEVSLEHPRYYVPFTELVAQNPNIVSCYYMTGDYDFMLKIITDSSDSLELIHRMLKSLDGVSGTKTHVVLKSVKNRHNRCADHDLFENTTNNAKIFRIFFNIAPCERKIFRIFLI